MKLSDIIIKDSDRVFKVNPECFIIYTGDSLTDQKPFIRIGNWLDLPTEMIPLTENIIITDLMSGNPAYEQFNIDVKYLPTNRYIGSSTAINKFLTYQKVFGLNLDNASIIDAEKDIPEISQSSNISDKNSFIGIFYNDGNFKITHKKKDLLDLKTCLETIPGDFDNHENIYQNSKYSSRYQGSGFVFIDNNPFFYDDNNMISYLFPNSYYKSFDKLEINPRSISAVIHPSSNFLGITKFLKWKHFNQGKINIFTDHSERFTPIKNLFNKATINLHSFSNLSHSTKNGFIVKSVSDSYNLELIHASENIKYAYIKGLKNIDKIIKSKPCFICINYSIFEDSSLLLKSAKCPVLVVDDGNPNIAKISNLDNNIILQNIQYNFLRHDSHDTVKSIFETLIDENIIKSIQDQNFDLKTINDYDNLTKFNILSYLKYIYKTTSNRKHAQHIRKIIQGTKTNFTQSKTDFIIELHITNDNVFELASPLKEFQEHKFFVSDDHISENIFRDISISSKQKNQYNKIFEDRERLYKLLTLYSKESPYKNEIQDLKKAIKERREILKNDFLNKEQRSTLNINNLFQEDESMLNYSETTKSNNKLSSLFNKKESTPDQENVDKETKKQKSFKQTRGQSNDPSMDNIDNQVSENNEEKTLTNLFKIAIILFIIILLSASSFYGYNYYKKYKTTKIAELKKQEEQIRLEKERQMEITKKAEEKRLSEKYSIQVQNREIYEFANKIAIKNGYNAFPNGFTRKRNPNWIFPGNKFTFPDGEIVTVKKGDTLWEISEKKLMTVFMVFYKNLDQIETQLQKGETPSDSIILETKEMIYTSKQQKDFNKIIKK